VLLSRLVLVYLLFLLKFNPTCQTTILTECVVIRMVITDKVIHTRNAADGASYYLYSSIVLNTTGCHIDSCFTQICTWHFF